MFDDLKKLFSDLYLVKFLDSKIVFSMKNFYTALNYIFVTEASAIQFVESNSLVSLKI